MKKVLILEGVGFSEALETQKIFEDLGFKTERFFLDQKTPAADFKLPETDILLLRGPWKLSSAEVLHVNAWSHRWQKVLKPYFAANAKTQVIGLGRGALMLFDFLVEGQHAFADWSWESILEDQGPWVDVQIEGKSGTFKALLHDHFRPELSNPALFQMEPWIKVNEMIVGWKLQKRVSLCLLDLFAFQDRAQHADFGYADLSQLSLPQDLFMTLFPEI